MATVLLIGARDARDVRSLLRQDRHRVTWARRTAGWRDTERRVLPDIVVAAVADTASVIAEPGTEPRGFPAPLLFLDDLEEGAPGPYNHARFIDRMPRPFTAEQFLSHVDALASLRAVVQRGGHRRTPYRGSIGQRISDALASRVTRFRRDPGVYSEVANGVARWSDSRDVFEPGHAERVASYCALIADGLGFDDHASSQLFRAALLHDIGKVGLPVELMHQAGPLEDPQMRLMRTHPEKGARLLQAIDPDQAVCETIRYHHEQVDGKGYYGKSGAEIPLAARILAVAETYDAMTTSQVRTTVRSREALDRLSGGRDVQFDRNAVDALVDALRPRPRSVSLSPLPGLPDQG